MAQYVFVKLRNPEKSGNLMERLEKICSLLTPDQIRGDCVNTVAPWPDISGAYYAIQNSNASSGVDRGAMVIGWISSAVEKESQLFSPESDGSYAVIKANSDGVSFFTDQFGSRTLWQYFDENMLVVSTSQRAVVSLKREFCLNEEALAWFISSGCQGPFISWDKQIIQVRPDMEYVLNAALWRLDVRPKQGMELPPSGSVRLEDYLLKFEKQVCATLDKIIAEEANAEALLPISGGLDSRLILAFCKNSGLEHNVALANWGVPASEAVFDDKIAAQRVAKFYGKTLHDMLLPDNSNNYDLILNRFVEASEGRIDHFNGYTDGFSMWAEFFQKGYRTVLRGDIPFTEGLDLNDVQARSHIGLNYFNDYTSFDKNNIFETYAVLQNNYDMTRRAGESLVRWRDRLYVSWRVPMVISSFSDLISGFAENRAPMMNWSLFQMYMGLPDSSKGNKKHIKLLWQHHDHSGIPSHAVGSLRSPDAFFDSVDGRHYLEERVRACGVSGRFPSELVSFVLEQLTQHSNQTVRHAPSGFSQGARAWISDNMPIFLKAHLKTRRPKHLAAATIAYRLILSDKLLTMYEKAASTAPTGGQ